MAAGLSDERVDLDHSGGPTRTTRQRGERHGRRLTRTDQPAEKWTLIPVSPLVTEETFALAQARLVENAHFSTRNTKQLTLLQGVVAIGVDEISYRRGRRYLTTVVDHHKGAIVWCAPGRNAATLNTFFVALGDRRHSIRAVSIDMSGGYQQAIHDSISARRDLL